MTTRTLARWLPLPLLAAAAAALAQTPPPPIDVEVGYRHTNVDGNEDMYRTQINERSGFLLRAFTMQTVGEPASIMDHFRIDANDLGTGPAGALRIDAGKSGKYRVRLGYRRTNFFSPLPEFANPLLGQCVIPGQHTYDRNRQLLDVDVDFLSFSKISPFVGYTMNRYSGPGTTTVHLGQDEFLLGQSLRNVDHEFRAGFGFSTSVWSGSVTQGYRRFHDDETLSLVPGAGNGNNSAPVLGRDITPSGITRMPHDTGSTTATRARAAPAHSRRSRSAVSSTASTRRSTAARATRRGAAAFAASSPSSTTSTSWPASSASTATSPAARSSTPSTCRASPSAAPIRATSRSSSTRTIRWSAAKTSRTSPSPRAPARGRSASARARRSRASR